MSTLNEGSGTPVEPTAHGDSDTPISQVPNPAGAARQQGNGNGAQAAAEPAPGGGAGGLPGLAGFAQTDAYALKQEQDAEPQEPEPEVPAALPDMPPLIPDPGAPAAPSIAAEPEAPTPPVDEPAPELTAPEEPVLRQDEPVLPPGEPFIPPLPQDETPPEDATFEASIEPQAEAAQEADAATDIEEELEQVWHAEEPGDLTPADDFSLAETAEPEVEAAAAAEETAAEDDFSAFSKDSLERFLAGEGTLPAEEAASEPPAADEAFAPEPGLEAAAPEEAEASDQVATDLQAFEARYDQHPEIPIGDLEEPQAEAPLDEPFFSEEPDVDADFLDAGQPADAAEGTEGKGNKRTIMVASALVGSLALGGALAFAYKNSGALIGGSGEPPLIQADNKPVKQTPEKPGGKQFPHKNKLIYDRLQGEATPEVEKLVPRQEEVAAAVQDGAETIAKAAPGAAGAPVPAVPAVPGPSAAEGGPKKVKTLVVRPDGTVMQPPQTATAAAPSQALGVPGVPQVPEIPAVPGAPATAAQPAAQPPVAQPERKPTPQQVKPPTRTAAAPAPRAAASGSKYVVQVAARKSQTDALAAFADLQQKYPNLLNNYRPIIERADLGSKGVWYRLRVGPLNQKTSAANLCRKLKSAGMSSCLVRSYSGS